MYASFYKLNGKPFRLSPDPDFFFASRGHKRALAYLRYGLAQDEGFVVITGAPGMGKTTLAQILLKELGDDVIVAHLTTTQLGADDMLRMVVASLGLRYEAQDKAVLLKSLESFLMARARENKRVLLVVDEAQNLPPTSLEELRMLSNLQSGGKALVQTFLLGQAQFRQMLDTPALEQLRQRVIANYHLSAIGEDESKGYIENRLKHVGWDNDPAFHHAALKRIYEYTEGIPRRINVLCDRILLYGFLEGKHVITANVVQHVIDELENEISGRAVEADEGEQKIDLSNGLALDLAADAEESNVQPLAGDSGRSAAISTGPGDDEALQQRQPVAAGSADAVQPAVDVASHIEADRLAIDRAVAELKGAVASSTAQSAVSGGDAVQGAAAYKTQSADKDRFRVIAGGKRPAEAGPVQLPSDVDAIDAELDHSKQEIIDRKILRLVLAFHRSPRNFPGLDDVGNSLPEGITNLLEMGILNDVDLMKIRPIAVAGVSPEMFRAAMRFFIRRVFFATNGDAFRALGLTPSAGPLLVEKHYDLLMKLFRRDKQNPQDDCVQRIGAAYETLSARFHGAAQGAASREGPAAKGSLPPVESVSAPRDDGRFDFEPSASFTPMAPPLEQPGLLGSRRRILVLGLGGLVVVALMYITQVGLNGPDKGKAAAVEPPVVADAVINKSGTASVDRGRSGLPDEEEGDVNGTQATTPPAANVAQERAAAERVAREQQMMREAEARARLEAAARATAEAQTRKEVEARQRAEARAKAEAEARVQAETLARTEREGRQRAEQEALARTQAEARAREELAAKQRAEREAQLRAEAEAKARLEAEAKARAAAESKAKIEAEQAKAEQARADADAKAKADAVARARGPTVVAVTPPVLAPKVPDTKAADTKAIDQADLVRLLKQFVNAYEAGDLEAIMKFFALQARTNDQTGLSDIRKDYQALFASSTRRKMSLKDVSWDIDNNFARGVGGFEARVLPKDQTAETVVTGRLTVQVEKNSQGLLITRFYHAEQDVKAASTAQSGSGLTKAALDGVLARFIARYEAGDIEGFMALFDKDAETNDRTGLQGIREDHLTLFSTTDVRQMFLKNMQWTIEAKSADGVADFEVMVKPKGKTGLTTYNGQIRLELVQGPTGGLLIKKMYHFQQ